jgi:methylmalonyl-CoA mutase
LEFSWRYKSKTILSFRWYFKTLNNTKVSEFKICQNIFVFDIIYRACYRYTQRGAESLVSLRITNIHTVRLLEKTLETTPVYFHFNLFQSIRKTNWCNRHKRKATIYCNLDPVGQLAQDGNWFSTTEKVILKRYKC